MNTKDKQGVTPLQYAALSGRREIVELLIVKGVDINSNESGPTPLNISIITGRVEIAQLLLSNSADANVRNIDTKTPLDLAYEWKQKKIANLLRKHGGKTGEELKAEGIGDPNYQNKTK